MLDKIIDEYVKNIGYILFAVIVYSVAFLFVGSMFKGCEHEPIVLGYKTNGIVKEWVVVR